MNLVGRTGKKQEYRDNSDTEQSGKYWGSSVCLDKISSKIACILNMLILDRDLTSAR